MGPREREIERLEKELDDATPEERKHIMREIRDIARDMSDEERWRDEGYERGWTAW